MEGEWENNPDELQRARDKIQSALNDAKERFVCCSMYPNNLVLIWFVTSVYSLLKNFYSCWFLFDTQLFRSNNRATYYLSFNY